jgi:hypothetical protein
MPFTPAHSAIVLPLLKSRYFSATALIAGSVAPDFEYFIRMAPKDIHSHTIAGLFYFDLPVVVLISLLFHQVVKNNLIENLPGFLQQRFEDTRVFNFIHYIKNNPFVFLSSALIGSISHLFWDGFTHGNGYFATHLPFYRGTIVPFDGARYPFFYALQHVSTYVGLFIVILFIILKTPKQITIKKPSIFYWILMILITVIVLIVRFSIKNDWNLTNAVVSTISGSLIALVLCGFVNFKQHGKEITVGPGR